MALRESGEDYLESIYVLSERQGTVRSIDVAEYLGVTKASVSKAMATLESNGYVEMGKRDVHLTERGRPSNVGAPLLFCRSARGRRRNARGCLARGLSHGALPERGEFREVKVDAEAGRCSGSKNRSLTDPQ